MLSFTAPEAGTWRLEVDPVLTARGGCVEPQSQPVLACSDDVDLANDDLSARVALALDEGEAVHLVVEAFNGNFSGPFRLRADPVE